MNRERRPQIVALFRFILSIFVRMRVYYVIAALLLNFSCFSFLKKKNDYTARFSSETVFLDPSDKKVSFPAFIHNRDHLFEGNNCILFQTSGGCISTLLFPTFDRWAFIYESPSVNWSDFPLFGIEAIIGLKSDMLYPTHYFW